MGHYTLPSRRELEARLYTKGRLKQVYRGIAGYRAYAIAFANDSMGRAHQTTSKVLTPKEFSGLGWGLCFCGSVTEHSQIRPRLFVKGRPRPEFVGITGYKAYARQFTRSGMARAFMNVSAALPKRDFLRLGWGKFFAGTVSLHEQIRERLFNGNLPREKYCNVNGYRAYTKRFHRGQMNQATLEVSAVLTPQELKQLNWGKQFSGSVDEHAEVYARLFRNGRPRSEFLGVVGYRLYSIRFCNESMSKAFHRVSAVLSAANFALLNWGKLFNGTVDEHSSILPRLFVGARPRKKFCGVDGYRAYATEFHLGSMSMAYQTVSAALSAIQFAKLRWGKRVNESVAEHRNIRARIFQGGSPRGEYLGVSGYRLYAARYAFNSMQRAYMAVSAALATEQFAKLRWGKQFQGSVEEHEQVRSRLFRGGRLRREYCTPAGYRSYALAFTNGSMDKAFQNVSAVISSEEFEMLGWSKKFRGDVDDYDLIPSRLFDATGQVRRSFRGKRGQLRYAKMFTARKPRKAYDIVRSRLDDEEYKKLRWSCMLAA